MTGRKLIGLVLVVAAAVFTLLRATNSDAWAVGHYGAAIGESSVPLTAAVIIAGLIWPRKRKQDS